MILALTIVIFLLLYFYIKYRFDFWKNRGFPSANPSIPFGNIKGVGRKTTWAAALKEVYDQFRGKEDFVGIFFFTDPAILVINPELAKCILVKDFHHFSDRGMYSNKFSDPLSHNMVRIDFYIIHKEKLFVNRILKNSYTQLTMKIDDWKPRRTKITATFSTGKIKLMFDIISGITDNLVNKLSISDDDGTNISEMIALYSTDIISSIAFGIDSNCKYFKFTATQTY